ncbi:hypothetical protein SDC9_139990 [bioreactor metagenome]|uniref:Uncharacterized protein n=1 Tax=bioreactor metagenome TaxID=1076179 RepID=A0A645DTM5_9ZZZZ
MCNFYLPVSLSVGDFKREASIAVCDGPDIAAFKGDIGIFKDFVAASLLYRPPNCVEVLVLLLFVVCIGGV